MSTRLAAAVIVAWLLAGCGAVDRGDAERAVREANARYDRAVISGDAAALGDLLAGDYVYVSSEGEVRNKAQQIASLSAPQFNVRSPGSQEVTVRWIGDQALVIGRFPGEVRVGGNSMRFNERYSALWTLDGDSWRIRHEHASLIPERR